MEKSWITKEQHLEIFRVDFIMKQGAYGGPRIEIRLIFYFHNYGRKGKNKTTQVWWFSVWSAQWDPWESKIHEKNSPTKGAGIWVFLDEKPKIYQVTTTNNPTTWATKKNLLLSSILVG